MNIAYQPCYKILCQCYKTRKNAFLSHFLAKKLLKRSVFNKSYFTLITSSLHTQLPTSRGAKSTSPVINSGILYE